MATDRHVNYLEIIASPATPERLREVCRKHIRAEEILAQVRARQWRLIRNRRLLEESRTLIREAGDLLAAGITEAEVRESAAAARVSGRMPVIFPQPRTERDLWLNP